ncbi:MAG: FAD-binding oxidoreductase [Alphaproteobacteria bacterium]|nr:FAD-binding oxidoreductase [Alphaproteobacteria bacterium]
MSETSDFIVIGGGIAGSSAAYELSQHGRVVLLEREDHPGYHSTGRSAATLIEGYGNAIIRGLAAASRSFFESPPPDFAAGPLSRPITMLFIAREDQLGSLDDELNRHGGADTRLSASEAVTVAPILDPDYVAAGLVDSTVLDLDVHAIQQGYLRGLKARGSELKTGTEARAINFVGDTWCVDTGEGSITAPILVNAAGAWADRIAALAGLTPLGLVPKRRTAINIDGPDNTDVSSWAMVVDIDECFYFKPDAGRLLVSPADETPSEPTDAQPEDLDVAIAVDRFETATTMSVKRITHKWAGLRSFFPDKTPVAGESADAPGFFWLAGQGGYGIMTAPAMAQVLATSVMKRDLPRHLAECGVGPNDLSPSRSFDPI